jgi:hypothetical protein
MDSTVYLLIQKPAYQALLFLLLTPVLILVIQPRSADMAWTIATIIFVLFLIVNAGMLWFDDKPWRYFLYSIGFSVAYLLIIAHIIEGLLKLMRLDDSGESAMAFLVIIYQPFALLLVMLAKWIVTNSTLTH